MKKLSVILVLILIMGSLAVIPASAVDQYIEAAGYAFCTVDTPTGGGNKDITIIQDGYTDDTNSQYDTYRGGDNPEEIAFGYTFDKAYTIKQVEFTEGGHFGDGGWYADGKIRVQAFVGNAWVDVSSLKCAPDYPVSNDQADFGDPYETFTFTFSPIECTGIQVIGTPGGTATFTSCAELKVVAEVAQLETLVTVEMRLQAEKEARIKELIAMGYIEGMCTPIVLVTEPQGGGSKNLGVINDGYIPVEGDSYGAVQYDTVNDGTHPDANKFNPGHEEWIGYEFPEAYIISSVEFTEGGNFFDGGWFANESLVIQVLQNGKWVNITSKSTPAYPVSKYDDREDFLPDFETYVFTFDPVECTGVRLHGEAGGSAAFISCSELRVKIDPSQLDALIAEKVEPAAPVEAVSATPALTPNPAQASATAPQTADPIIFVSVIALISAAGASIVKKRNN